MSVCEVGLRSRASNLLTVNGHTRIYELVRLPDVEK